MGCKGAVTIEDQWTNRERSEEFSFLYYMECATLLDMQGPSWVAIVLNGVRMTEETKMLRL